MKYISKLAFVFGSILFMLPVSGHAQLFKDIKKKGWLSPKNNTKANINLNINLNLNKNKNGNADNIKYKQNPDVRDRDDIKISKRQKLVIQNGKIEDFAWNPLINFDNDIFPSFIIGWAAYEGDKYEDIGSCLGFTINGSIPNVVFKWEIECVDKKYFTIDSGFIKYDNAGSTLNFKPRISWDYRALCKRQTSAPIGVYFRLIDPNTGKKVEKLVTINLRSINDCIGSYNGTKYDFMFVSYINEDHPEIDNILREALDTKIISDITGYQDGAKGVDLQISAIWKVLHDRKFTYSSITHNSGYQDKSTKIHAQSVRTFDNALKTNQANCVDGTVVFASILKKIGIHTAMILVPGHCFLGYYTDDDKTDMNFLETTMLGASNKISNPKLAISKDKQVLTSRVPSSVKLTDKNKAYYLQFYAAKMTAGEEFVDYIKKYGKENVTILDVDKLRQYIKPIPVYLD